MKKILWLATFVAASYVTQLLAAQDWANILPPRPRGVLVETDDASPRETLGRRLFFDPILSANGKVSCSTCHDPTHGWASRGRPTGLDGLSLSRKAPSLFNRRSGTHFFWDGRVNSLEEQAAQVMRERKEMGNVTLAPVVERLKGSKYQKEFDRAFVDGVTSNNLCTALADFERTIQRRSRWDKFNVGREEYSATEYRGFRLFTGRANCYRCHTVNDDGTFTDEQFHATGVGDRDGGRYNHTLKSVDTGKFKTPGLRGCSLTGPYMHDASLPTLDDVVDFYNRGGNKVRFGGDKDILIYPLGLTADDKKALVEFLKTL